MSYRPVATLLVRRVGRETELLFAHLQRELAEEAHVLAPLLPPDVGTPISVDFIDDRSREDAVRRIREVLDAERPDWTELLEFAEP